MKKNIVLYESKYGNTLQYATWIADELGWEISRFSDLPKTELDNYDRVIFGTAVYMGKMNKLKQALRLFKHKPIIIFATGGNNNVQKDIDDIKQKNFTAKQLAFHKFFYLPGGVDFSKAEGTFKKMLTVFQKVMGKVKNKPEGLAAILAAFDHPTNYVARDEIEEMVEYVRGS